MADGDGRRRESLSRNIDGASRLEVCSSSQALRAAASVPANIAEGYGRGTTGSYVYFLKVARGSLKELETHLLLAQRVGALPAGQVEAIQKELEGVGKMLNALIRSVRSSQAEEALEREA